LQPLSAILHCRSDYVAERCTGYRTNSGKLRGRYRGAFAGIVDNAERDTALRVDVAPFPGETVAEAPFPLGSGRVRGGFAFQCRPRWLAITAVYILSTSLLLFYLVLACFDSPPPSRQRRATGHLMTDSHVRQV